MKRDMGTLLSPLYMLSVLDSISLTDTVDVGNGIYIKDGKEIRDHNADWGGYGVLTAEQVILFDSKVGMTKIMERYNEKELQYSPLEVVDFYNRIANKDSSLCSPKVMEDIRNMLSKVITGGTGKNLYREDVPIAGKTGKAETEVSACVYFTLDEAVYTCLVIISNPKKGVPSGGTMCGNVIKEIVNQLKEE